MKKQEEMLIKQNGKCICGRDNSTNKISIYLHVDHDHETGKVRGLLCFSCNRILGASQDNPEILKILIEYLQRNGK